MDPDGSTTILKIADHFTGRTSIVILPLAVAKVVPNREQTKLLSSGFCSA